MITLRRIAVALVIAMSACAAPATTASPTAPVPSIGTSSPESTPVATKTVPWSELRWSTPVAIPDQSSIFRIVSWRDGYVAAGQTTDSGQYVGATFASRDGMRWARTAIMPLNPLLVVTTTGVLAVATVRRDNPPPRVEVWASADGASWQPQDGLSLTGATIDHLAARGSTIVGIGTDSSGHAAVWRSVDRAAWTRGDPPSPRAIVRDVSALSDGFIAYGREGEPDVASGGIGSPGVGLPAAWWSAEGRVWTSLGVEGKPAAGAQLIELFAIANGYIAVGSDTTDPSLGTRTALIWTSSDARTWLLSGPRPYWTAAGSNGLRAVAFAPSLTGARSLEARVSRDGVQWMPMSFAGDLANIPNAPGFAQGAQMDQVFVAAHGIIVIGQQNGHPVAWFADAEPR